MNSKDKHKLDKFFIVLWLISNTIILTLFSTKLYEIIMNQQIIDYIESIDQLLTKSNWIDSEILIFDQNMYDMYIRSSENENNKLFERSEPVDPSQLCFDNLYQKEIVEKVLIDNAVIVSNRLIAHYLIKHVQNVWPQTMSRYIEGIHFEFSKPAEVYNLYYLPTFHDTLGQTLLDKFNNM